MSTHTSKLEDLFEDNSDELARDVKLGETMEKYYDQHIFPNLIDNQDNHFDIPADSGFTAEDMKYYLQSFKNIPNATASNNRVTISPC